MACLSNAFLHSRVFVGVLHASDDVLRQRVLGREADGFRDIPIAMRTNLESVRDVKPFETSIDTSNLPPSDVTKAILAAIQGGCVGEASQSLPV